MKSLLTLLLPLLFAANGLFAAETNPRPNIIVILADDLGIGNVSCYGADNFKTPRIDALAKSGVRFEKCFAAPLCGPSRALMMTGRYAFRTGVTGNDSAGAITPQTETLIPQVLKTAGYVTAQTGKWGQIGFQPADWGFDEYLRFSASGKYWREQTPKCVLNGKPMDLPKGKYLPDSMHEFLVDFIGRNKEKPFYIHYAMSHVHGEILRTPDSAPDSKDLYSDNIAYMDKLVGKLVAELDRLKLRERTLLIFTSDNGTAKSEFERSTINGRRLSGHKSHMLEGGSLVPMIASWPGTTPAGKVSQSLIDFSDFMPTLAELAGAKLPSGVTIDGQSFAALLRGKSGKSREWIFVELGKHWFVRDANWKLNEAGELFDMKAAPFEEMLVSAHSQNATVINARKRLLKVLDQLNPAGGKVDSGDGSGKHAKNVKEKKK